MAATTKTYAYVGTFVMPNPSKNEGLHAFQIDRETGALIPIASHTPELNVGSFAVDHKRGILYAVDEVASNAEFRQQAGAPGGGGGRVYAYSIDSASGDLTELGHWPSFGTQPAGVALDKTGDFLIVSHFTSRATTTQITGDAQTGYKIEPRYDNATTVLFPLDAAGRLGAPCDVHVHDVPAGGIPSCLHSVTLSRDGSFLVECDMYNDQILIFAVDTTSKSLRLQSVHKTPKGSGPRYSVFHPTLPVFYANYEYEPVIEVFSYREGGGIKSLGTVNVIPDDVEKVPGSLLSDLCAHPSGKYLYTLVRGLNYVSVFAVDETTGSLKRIQSAQLNGTWPKGCAPSPDGRFLYVSVAKSDEVQVWRIGDDGLLTYTEQKVAVERPNVIKIVDRIVA